MLPCRRKRWLSQGPGEGPPKKRRCSPSWARLISKVYQADPLVCKRCGGPLQIVAYITDTVAIRRILDHLGLSPPEKPPPDVREVVRVPVDDEGREILAGWSRQRRPACRSRCGGPWRAREPLSE